ncbi:efflux RND transporter periplasmic adaptor subunit [Flavobacterium agricola]|uniref:Efflux RND transporter periplasmic adaptor subunit n=1 Tax=Flavobacterium agricola TaxID=2870839 RepID=A0ABY6LXP2_9FLAO|nr:efflux RND transporter periplasmic adaptor subunit [Flavobacterium agricola]UYW00752.1 efflux RND transporter periplasmic adaptor subunit [Flavobacterium agricola]
MKKKIFIGLGILIVGFIAFKTLSKDKNANHTQVETYLVEMQTVTEMVSATGKIQPEIEVKIASEVSGEIIELPVKEGQQVKKGDLLVRINPDLYQSGVNRAEATLSTSKAGLQQAEAQLKEAKLNYDRNKQLFAKGVISKSEWDKVVSTYEVAVAAKQSSYYNVQSSTATLTESRDNLRRTTIYAPSDGTISKLSVELGERVMGTQGMSSTELLRIANLNNMEVEVDVNENDIVKVNIGDRANIEVDAYAKKKFKGTVTSISNSSADATSADQVTNFKVKVRIDKDSYADLMEGKSEFYSPFRPGMTATVDIITNKKENIIAIPISAVVLKADTSAVAATAKTSDSAKKSDTQFECVFVKNGDEAKIKVVKTGIQDDSNIEIISGLAQGDEVIIGPYSVVSKTLTSGTKVTNETKK